MGDGEPRCWNGNHAPKVHPIYVVDVRIMFNLFMFYYYRRHQETRGVTIISGDLCYGALGRGCFVSQLYPLGNNYFLARQTH